MCCHHFFLDVRGFGCGKIEADMTKSIILSWMALFSKRLYFGITAKSIIDFWHFETFYYLFRGSKSSSRWRKKRNVSKIFLKKEEENHNYKCHEKPKMVILTGEEHCALSSSWRLMAGEPPDSSSAANPVEKSNEISLSLFRHFETFLFCVRSKRKKKNRRI